MHNVEIYTDGACRGNPGNGGWGVVLKYKTIIKEIYGFEKNTTNNRMELLAAINGFQALKTKCNITMYTDSKYVKLGITNWINKWVYNNWKTSNKKDVKNCDLWKILYEESNKHIINWKWIKGHSGNMYNEIADKLANRGIDEYFE